jgi:hypothetical protein
LLDAELDVAGSRIRERYGLGIFRRFFERIVE